MMMRAMGMQRYNLSGREVLGMDKITNAGSKGVMDEALAAARQRPFAATFEKYNSEYASGTISGSQFPYHLVSGLPGYAERNTPSLNATDVAKEIARHLAEYAKHAGVTLPYFQRHIGMYLWAQASRGMMDWEQILSVIRAAKKKDHSQPIAHYFGYLTITGTKGVAKNKKLIKMIRYITQEGACAGCQREFRFVELTLDRILPGAANGAYDLANVQLMCQPCNGRKGDRY